MTKRAYRFTRWLHNKWYWRVKAEYVHRARGIESPGKVRVLGATIHHNSYRVLGVLYREVFHSGTYDVGDLGDSPVIVDCGANIGIASWFFQERYPGSKVIAVEPSPLSCELLRRNVDENGWNVEVHQEASADAFGEVTLHFKPGQFATPSASIQRGRVDGESITVPAAPLSARIPASVDLLKVDIEGAEHEVFKELEGSGALDRVKRIAVEYHHHIPGAGADLPSFLSLLERNGFNYSITAAGSRSVPGSYQDMMVHGVRARSQVA